MAINLKKMSANPELLAPGHRSCAGCAAPAILRQVLHVAGPDTVIGFATGCMEVSTTIYPYTAWKVPYVHCAFENSAATISGAEAAYRALQRRGRIPQDKKINFIAFGGDGGTYDIGLQSLSGAMERGHNMLYICYDNNAYMNTGIQRSSATPRGAATNTSPAGKVIPGKQQQRKDLTAILIAHHIPYVAQAAVSSREGPCCRRPGVHQHPPAVPPRLAPQAGGLHRSRPRRRRDPLLAAVRGRPRRLEGQLQAQGSRPRRRVVQAPGPLQAPPCRGQKRCRRLAPAADREELGRAAPQGRSQQGRGGEEGRRGAGRHLT